MQMESTECGAASLGAILAYHGVYRTLEQLREECDISRDGSNALAIIKAAEKYHLEGKGVRSELHNLHEIVTLPAIIFWKFNHFLVLEGYNTKNGEYYLNDPAKGRITVPYQEFDESFTGVALIFKKTKEFQPLGEPAKLHNSIIKRLSDSTKDVVYLALITLFLAIPGLVVPLFSKVFIDDVLIRGLDSVVKPLLIAMVITFMVQTLLLSLQRLVLTLLTIKLTISSSAQFMYHIFRLPILFFSQRYLGDIADRIASNERISQSLSNNVAINSINLVTSAIYGSILLLYDYVLGILTILMVSINFLVLAYLNERRDNANQVVLKEKGGLLGISMNGLKIISTLKASGIENMFFKRWAGYQARMINAKQKLTLYSYILVLAPTFLSGLTTVLIVYVGSYKILDGVLTVGGLIAFQALAQQFMSPISNLVSFGAELQQLKGDFNRLEDVLSYKQDPLKTSTSKKKMQHVRMLGKLSVEDLTFGYQRQGKPVLKNINFTIEPGSSVAIVGSSGSGKSTLLKLISRLYAPHKGCIKFDDCLANEIDDFSFSRSVASVDQNIILFEGSVRDNLSLWDMSIRDQQIGQALRDAALLDVINKLPNHYGYQIREGGANFSGGQRQCLEIARVLVNDPSIIILDEATAALDALIEKQIMDNIRKRCCTTIIVAHRLSTIRDADMIIVLEKGEIVQMGDHQQLVQDKEGPYNRLVQDQ